LSKETEQEKGTGYFSNPLSNHFAARGKPLLLIILDDLRRANLCVVRVEPDIAKGTSLAQEVPALIQFDLDFREPLTIGLGKFPLLVQSLFLSDKALNIIENWLIPNLILHESLLSRDMFGRGHDFMLRPTETGVNRSYNQHVFPVNRKTGHSEFRGA
jgi:hypothetical protein